MKNKIFLVLLALILALAPLAAAGAESPETVMNKVQAQYDQSGGFKTRFQQESRLKALHQTDSAAGLMYFQKPCRMKWLYEMPASQKKEVVSDGRLVWMYMPQDSLVMVYKLDQVLRSDLVMRFFSGLGQFQKDFTISWSHPPKEGEPLVIDLVPKKEQPELKHLTLTVNPRTYLVDKLAFTNALGEETRFTFSQMDLHVKLEPGFFNFKPPPGVQVVQQNPGS